MERLAEALSMRRRACAEGGACHADGPFHAAAIFLRSTACVLAYGENSYYVGKNDRDGHNGGGGTWTVHAESSAIARLPTQPRRRRLLPVDMLVIRTSRSGLLGPSRPCLHCVVTMCRTLPERGYSLNRVHYSDEKRGINTIKLRDLAQTSLHVSKYHVLRRAKKLESGS